jgi:hypothetical protein
MINWLFLYTGHKNIDGTIKAYTVFTTFYNISFKNTEEMHFLHQ